MSAKQKDKLYNVRLNKEDLTKWKKLAKNHGYKLSGLIRDLLIRFEQDPSILLVHLSSPSEQLPQIESRLTQVMEDLIQNDKDILQYIKNFDTRISKLEEEVIFK